MDREQFLTGKSPEEEFKDRVNGALNQLSDAHRVAITLVDVYGWTYEDLEQYGIPADLTRDIVNDALRYLRFKVFGEVN